MVTSINLGALRCQCGLWCSICICGDAHRTLPGDADAPYHTPDTAVRLSKQFVRSSF